MGGPAGRGARAWRQVINRCEIDRGGADGHQCRPMNRFAATFFYFFGFFSPKHVGGCTNA